MDIFGEDMTVDNFIKEISKLSDVNNEKEVKQEDTKDKEGTGKGLFARRESLICIYCNTECPNGEVLAQHFEDHRDIHEDRRTEPCGVCGKTFKRKNYLKYHMQVHQYRRTEPCGVCGKTFKRKDYLKHHMRIHTDEKPYRCTECGTSFITRYFLKIHTKRKHTREKPFRCQECGQCFVTNWELRKHEKVHIGEVV